jgi:hypothetical protein
MLLSGNQSPEKSLETSYAISSGTNSLTIQPMHNAHKSSNQLNDSSNSSGANNMDIISMINYAAMNKDYAWIQQIKQDIIDKAVLKNSRQEVIDVVLQYIDDIIPSNQQ